MAVAHRVIRYCLGDTPFNRVKNLEKEGASAKCIGTQNWLLKQL